MPNMSIKSRFFISMIIACTILIVSLSIVFYGFYQVYFAPSTLFKSSFYEITEIESYFEHEVVNVLVLGLHNRNEDNTFGDIYYIDTIILASINFDLDSLCLLAVPRDSYVKIAGSDKWDRIRQSYSYGYEIDSTNRHDNGLNYAVETLNNLLGENEIQYYIAMDVQGLTQLIDSMGGVYYMVEKPLISFTPQESLDAGLQLLDGQGYLNYITYREPDARDDMNRMKRQKSLLLATFSYFKEMGLFSYVLPTYAAYRDYVYTNLNFNQVAALTLFAANRLEEDAIRDYSLNGEYISMDGGNSYYLLIDEKKKEEILNIIFGRPRS